jgi:hypothetical protein
LDTKPVLFLVALTAFFLTCAALSLLELSISFNRSSASLSSSSSFSSLSSFSSFSLAAYTLEASYLAATFVVAAGFTLGIEAESV